MNKIFNGKLIIDHNHGTNEIRGLLCYKCNIGLGQYNDDLKLILKAFNYLNKNENSGKNNG